MTTVSVIVPTRNSARTVEACLRSIRAQTSTPFELIVIDNNSRDGTTEIAARYADRLDTCGPERSNQRNHGAELATGDYLLFIDSDMVLNEGVIAECVATIDGTGAPAAIIPEDSFGAGFWAHCRTLERKCYDGVDSVEAARCFRRAAFSKVGGYDPLLIGVEDWDLSDRVASGQTLPRIHARIAHDEGQIDVWSHLQKKRYYGRTFSLYWQKPNSRKGRSPIRSVYLRHWRKLLAHPVLTAGMLSLKVAEGIALAIGFREGPRPI